MIASAASVENFGVSGLRCVRLARHTARRTPYSQAMAFSLCAMIVSAGSAEGERCLVYCVFTSHAMLSGIPCVTHFDDTFQPSGNGCLSWIYGRRAMCDYQMHNSHTESEALAAHAECRLPAFGL